MKNFKRPMPGLLIVASLATVPLLQVASAATGGAPAAGEETLETIEIIAQRQPFRGDTPLQELPQSVQVLPAEIISAVGATKLDGLLDMASGVARQNTFGGLWDSFAIRGFAGDENTPSGYLVNGFNAGRGFSGRRDASNLERVEVLKGPGLGPVWPQRAGRHDQPGHEEAAFHARRQRRAVGRQLQHLPRVGRLHRAAGRRRGISHQWRLRGCQELPRLLHQQEDRADAVVPVPRRRQHHRHLRAGVRQAGGAVRSRRRRHRGRRARRRAAVALPRRARPTATPKSTRWATSWC